MAKDEEVGKLKKKSLNELVYIFFIFFIKVFTHFSVIPFAF